MADIADADAEVVLVAGSARLQQSVVECTAHVPGGSRFSSQVSVQVAEAGSVSVNCALLFLVIALVLVSELANVIASAAVVVSVAKTKNPWSDAFAAELALMVL